MMKKIISIVAALSIIISATTFATVASAAEPTDPTLKVTLNSVVQASDEVEYAAGTTFKLTVSYENLPAWESEDTYEGISLAGLGFNLSLPGYGTYYEQYNSKSFVTESLKKEAGGTSVKNLDGTTYIYSWAGGIAADDSWRQPSGDIITLYLKVTKDMTESDVFELSEAKLQSGNFNSSDEWTHDTIYNLANDNLNIQNATIEIAGGEQAEDVVDTTYTGTTQTEGTGTQAVSFRRTAAIVTGKTPYWSAKFGETTKYCKAVTGVNLSGGGNVKLGLVYVGTEAISDVTLTWK